MPVSTYAKKCFLSYKDKSILWKNAARRQFFYYDMYVYFCRFFFKPGSIKGR